MDTIKRCIFTVFVAVCLISGCGSQPPEQAAPVWTGEIPDKPHVLPLGDKYIFRVPKGTKGGRTGYGALRFHIKVGQDSVHWSGRWDIESPTVGAMTLHTLVEPITDRYGSGPRRPVKEPSIVINGNVLAFQDSRLFLRLLWLKDARGDYAELNCAGSPELFDHLAKEKTLDVLNVTNCRFYFRPKEDVTAMMQLIDGERIPEFISRAEDIYNLVSSAIEDTP